MCSAVTKNPKQDLSSANQLVEEVGEVISHRYDGSTVNQVSRRFLTSLTAAKKSECNPTHGNTTESKYLTPGAGTFSAGRERVSGHTNVSSCNVAYSRLIRIFLPHLSSTEQHMQLHAFHCWRCQWELRILVEVLR